MRLYRQVKIKFFEHFKENELLEDLTNEKMQTWKTHLTLTIAKTTISGYLKDTKACFNWAVSSGWIEKSPLEGVGAGSSVNRSNDRIIPMEDYRRLLDACPCPPLNGKNESQMNIATRNKKTASVELAVVCDDL